MMVVEFLADKIKIYPPTAGEEVKVTLTTGIYSLKALVPAFVWQEGNQGFRITIEPVS